MEDNCDNDNAGPAIEPSQGAHAFKKPENHGQYGSAYNNGQQEALELIQEEGLYRRFVKAETVFNHKG